MAHGDACGRLQVGVGGNSCADDEGMLNLIRGGSTASASKPTLVADCRPMLNAMVRLVARGRVVDAQVP